MIRPLLRAELRYKLERERLKRQELVEIALGVAVSVVWLANTGA